MINGLLTGLIFIGLCQYSASKFNETDDCQGETFRCFDGSACLPSSFFCDGKSNCADDSDEYSCKNETCKESEFRCYDGTCAPKYWRCDGVSDCKDGSDEIQCTEEEMCSNGYWKCSKGRCIPQNWRCDHESDCEDGSDEIGCHVACKEDHFECTSGVCIPNSWRCDSHPDCSDASDEINCKNNTLQEYPDLKSNFDSSAVNSLEGKETESCKDDHFLCDKKRCIPKQWICDLEVDCIDKTDEEQCLKGNTTNSEFTTSALIDSTIPLSSLNNTLNNTMLIMSASELPCKEDHFLCDDDRCIPNAWICDRGKDCLDQSDELNCTRTQEVCSEDEIQCGISGTCIPLLWRCDGEFDCFDKTDEQDCIILPSVILDEENSTANISFTNTSLSEISIPEVDESLVFTNESFVLLNETAPINDHPVIDENLLIESAFTVFGTTTIDMEIMNEFNETKIETNSVQNDTISDTNESTPNNINSTSTEIEMISIAADENFNEFETTNISSVSDNDTIDSFENKTADNDTVSSYEALNNITGSDNFTITGDHNDTILSIIKDRIVNAFASPPTLNDMEISSFEINLGPLNDNETLTETLITVNTSSVIENGTDISNLQSIANNQTTNNDTIIEEIEDTAIILATDDTSSFETTATISVSDNDTAADNDITVDNDTATDNNTATDNVSHLSTIPETDSLENPTNISEVDNDVASSFMISNFTSDNITVDIILTTLLETFNDLVTSNFENVTIRTITDNDTVLSKSKVANEISLIFNETVTDNIVNETNGSMELSPIDNSLNIDINETSVLTLNNSDGQVFETTNNTFDTNSTFSVTNAILNTTNIEVDSKLPNINETDFFFNSSSLSSLPNNLTNDSILQTKFFINNSTTAQTMNNNVSISNFNESRTNLANMRIGFPLNTSVSEMNTSLEEIQTNTTQIREHVNVSEIAGVNNNTTIIHTIPELSADNIGLFLNNNTDFGENSNNISTSAIEINNTLNNFQLDLNSSSPIDESDHNVSNSKLQSLDVLAEDNQLSEITPNLRNVSEEESNKLPKTENETFIELPLEVINATINILLNDSNINESSNPAGISSRISTASLKFNLYDSIANIIRLLT